MLPSITFNLIINGQTVAQIVITALWPDVAATVSRAIALDDGEPFDSLGSATLFADLAAMLHETQYTRLFRT